MSTEPTLINAPHLSGVLEELRQREPLFHRPELGATRRDFENMTDATFWEVGASGRRYGREFILETLESRFPQAEADRWAIHDFHCTEIAAENYLVTYTLLQGPRVTRRSTLWRRATTGWKVLYHQGTAVEP
ncbi:MAG: DUF4440 domain-containing protein [Gammaproteobacteria bacterium]